jgi:hypothetical protein
MNYDQVKINPFETPIPDAEYLAKIINAEIIDASSIQEFEARVRFVIWEGQFKDHRLLKIYTNKRDPETNNAKVLPGDLSPMGRPHSTLEEVVQSIEDINDEEPIVRIRTHRNGLVQQIIEEVKPGDAEPKPEPELFAEVKPEPPKGPVLTVGHSRHVFNAALKQYRRSVYLDGKNQMFIYEVEDAAGNFLGFTCTKYPGSFYKTWPEALEAKRNGNK